jgi:hypothetical protein
MLEKSLSHLIPILRSRFVVGVVFVLQLGLPVCCGVVTGVLTNLEPSASPIPGGAWAGATNCFLITVAFLFYQSFQMFCPSFVLLGAHPLFCSSVCTLFFVIQTFIHGVQRRKILQLYHNSPKKSLSNYKSDPIYLIHYILTMLFLFLFPEVTKQHLCNS